MTYITTLEFYQFIRKNIQVPNYPSSKTLETVDASGTLAAGSKIYLDHNNIIDNTLILSYGATADSVTALTLTTDYTIDLTKGQITITSAGATAIGANSVFAEYQHTDLVEDEYVSDEIDSSVAQFEKETNGVFDQLIQITREEQTGQGLYDYKYFPMKGPVNVVKTQLTADVTAIATTFPVDDTTGFVVGDILSIGTEQVTIDTVTDGTNLEVTRGAQGTTATTHSDNDWMINMAVETSTDSTNSVPSFTQLSFRDEWDVNEDTGYIQIYSSNSLPKGAYDRLNLTYKQGNATVPNDIKKCIKLMVMQSMALSGIGRAMVDGIQEFETLAVTRYSEQIRDIINRNTQSTGFNV